MTLITNDRRTRNNHEIVPFTRGDLRTLAEMRREQRNNANHVQVAERAQTSQAVTPTADGVFGSLVVNGGVRVKRTTVADTTYTILTSDYLIAVTSLTAPRTLTLPTVASAGIGRVVIIKDESGSAGTHTITIDGSGAETVDGAASVTITTNRGVVRVYCSGAAWFTW